MARTLFAMLLAALLAGCAGATSRETPAAYDPTPPGDMLGGWYDSSGPRGRSGGGP
jgi:hypothetical protein